MSDYEWPAGTVVTASVRGVKPVPKGSMRAFVLPGVDGAKPRAIITDSQKTLRPWAALVRDAVTEAMRRRGLQVRRIGGCTVRIMFLLPRPKGHLRSNGQVKPTAPAEPTTKPDVDKLTRGVLDALKGRVWQDDSQCVRIVVEKQYARHDDDVGATIEITPRPRTVEDATSPQLPEV